MPPFLRTYHCLASPLCLLAHYITVHHNLCCRQAHFSHTCSHPPLISGLSSALLDSQLHAASIVHTSIALHLSSASVTVQGCSLSSMTAALQCLDPLLTAYLDWRLLLRNLLANALPDLAAASTGSLLQLKQAMQQADSDADGLITQDELMTVDVSVLLTSLLPAPDAAASEDDAAVAASTLQEGTADEQACDSTEDAVPGAETQHASDAEGSSEHQEALDADGVENAEGRTDGQEGGDPDEQDLTEAGPDLSKAAEHVKVLLCQALWGDDSGAAVDIDEIMLFLSCAGDGKEGLQKAFDVLTAGSENGQVCLR